MDIPSEPILVVADASAPFVDALPWIGGVGVLLGLALTGWIALRSRSRRAVHLVDDAADVHVPEPSEPVVDRGLVARFRGALGRSRDALQGRFDALFGRGVVDQALFDDLEVTLLSADVGTATTKRLLDQLRGHKDADAAELRQHLRAAIRSLLAGSSGALASVDTPPLVILVIGVNGSGKTTTIGKLAARYTRAGKRVVIAAADTYRAAAIEQLTVWAQRAGADIVAHKEGADPGAVVYDTLEKARARGHDVVIIDTAGRLQTMKPLMEQLAKIRRVVAKTVPDGPHETLLVLDGTMGQNALSQARQFDEVAALTGVVVTKLDGTAKGGMVLTIAAEMELPVKLVGIGEQVDDLRDFDADAFAEAIA